MTSAVMSSQFSRKLSADEKRSEKDEATSYSKIYPVASRCYLEIAIAKRCRLHKLIRQRFALAIKIQQEDFALLSSSRKIPAGSLYIQTRASDVIFNQSRMLSKRCRLNKLLRHRLINQSQRSRRNDYISSSLCNQSQDLFSRKLQYPVASYSIQAQRIQSQ
ncbi:NAC transcription factor NAM-1-like [Dorcoceras hygrometricum]|uniref:NAC transcription factor NAM-1-like n=1 Tax=Dorcoceras hygrometricum TaxID=472368 RepID=A0A2Z7ARK6_9LAMI|nr:NAC transcription factor NAM-1-like [Dorcoceras hygrometricum]